MGLAISISKKMAICIHLSKGEPECGKSLYIGMKGGS